MNEFDFFFSSSHFGLSSPEPEHEEAPSEQESGGGALPVHEPEAQDAPGPHLAGHPEQADFSGAFTPPVLAAPAFAAPPDTEIPGEEPGPAIARVSLRQAGQVFYFAVSGMALRPGAKIIATMEQGPVLGEVTGILDADAPEKEHLSGTVLRPATAQDIAVHAENRILAAEASAFCKSCIRQRELDMKLVDVEVLHDRSKIIFFFTAPSRIDFRELVKDLVRNYRTRIELRQIGVRHETQMLGGLGNCGRVCCCHRHLRKFAPVTIKMAKEQNLFLNPAKLSGMCGRLLCCLSFEQSNYDEFNRRCPKIGKKYHTDNGVFRITRANMFSQSVCGVNDVGEEGEFSLEDWEAMNPSRAEPQHQEGRRAPAPKSKGMPHEAWGGDDDELDASPQGEPGERESSHPVDHRSGHPRSVPAGRTRRKKRPDKGRAPMQGRKHQQGHSPRQDSGQPDSSKAEPGASQQPGKEPSTNSE